MLTQVYSVHVNFMRNKQTIYENLSSGIIHYNNRQKGFIYQHE